MTDMNLAEPVIVEARGGACTLTLNRPAAHNPLTRDMVDGLLSALVGAEKDALTRVVVIAGSGASFCVGVGAETLREQHASLRPPNLGDELRKRFHPLIRQIRRMEKPVVASVNGPAAGAGAALALACDVRVCSTTARFVPGLIHVGLAPDCALAQMLIRGMGFPLAVEHAWTGRPITARQAEHFGLVNAVVPADELGKATRDLVEKLLKAPPRAVALTKRLFNRALVNDLDAQLDYEAHIQETLGKTRDHREGVAAFLEGRPPEFTGE
jgi:2-(1,2-epoxy-1,2-dihydrophenyl)acetyl-CoA isomerase